MTTERDERPGAGAAEAVGWAAGRAAARSGRDQVAYLLDQRDTLAKLQQRFGNLGPGQRQGHWFEWMHELSFNLDAIRQGSDQRLLVTTWLGRPHDPADLELRDAAGELLRGVQAKVVTGGAARLSQRNGLAAPKYDGLDLLLPGDHLDPTGSLLDRRLAMPDGPLHERYADVRARLRDHVEADGVTSTAVSTDQLREVDVDPDGFLNGRVRDKTLNAAAHAAISAGGAAAVTSLAGSVAADVIRHRDLGQVAWTDAAVQAARVGATATAAAAASTYASLTAQAAVATGSTGALTNALGGATGADLATVMARSVLTVAGAAHGVATGRLTATEAAAVTAEGVGRTAAVWACSAVGQAVIPVPVVGALVGGVVGQYGAAMVVQGFQLAILARDTSSAWDAAYDELLAQTDLVVARCEAERGQLDRLAAEYDTGFTRHVVPALDRVSEQFWTGDPDSVLADLADLVRRFDGTPQFASLAEFETFMDDPLATLVLDLGGPTR